MSKKVAYALAGIGIAVALLIVLVLFSVISISFLSPVAMLVIGGIGVVVLLAAWFSYAVSGTMSPYPNVQIAATVGFGLWFALVASVITIIGLRPDFLPAMKVLVTWVGELAIAAGILVLSIKALRK